MNLSPDALAMSFALTMTLTACASHWERSPGHEYADWHKVANQ